MYKRQEEENDIICGCLRSRDWAFVISVRIVFTILVCKYVWNDIFLSGSNFFAALKITKRNS